MHQVRTHLEIVGFPFMGLLLENPFGAIGLGKIAKLVASSPDPAKKVPSLMELSKALKKPAR
jgi:hypothetical protein